jgi:hypothetical protein
LEQNPNNSAHVKSVIDGSFFGKSRLSYVSLRAANRITMYSEHAIETVSYSDKADIYLGITKRPGVSRNEAARFHGGSSWIRLFRVARQDGRTHAKLQLQKTVDIRFDSRHKSLWAHFAGNPQLKRFGSRQGKGMCW